VYSEEKSTELCRRHRLHGALQSERFGGIYFYFCAASLLHWASPVMFEGSMSAACIAGPVLPFENEEVEYELRKKVEEQREFPKRDYETLVQNVPRMDMERVHSLGELLKHICTDLSDATVALLHDRDEAMELQSRLYEFIDERATSNYPFETERILRGRVAEGDSNSAERALQELFTALVLYSEKDIKKMRGRSLELLSLVSRAAVDGGADGDTILALNEEYIASIHAAQEAEMFLLQLTRAVRKYARLVQAMSTVEHVDVISRVKNYIQRNYAQKISLEEAAAQVNLSPSYLSKIFRREMGIGFISYLNKVRVEKSKVLLQNREIELVEAGGMVGYEDQSYFTRIFKRFTGIPPGKYREQRGRYPSDSHEIHIEEVKKQKRTKIN